VEVKVGEGRAIFCKLGSLLQGMFLDISL
jgi:hypothetical protein